jgi:hypothetical protein
MQEHFHVSLTQTAEILGTGIGLQVGADCKATFWWREKAITQKMLTKM